MKKLGTTIVICAAALAAVASISAASPAKTTATGQKNIVQTAVAAGKFKTLVSLVKKAGLAGTLSAPGTLTVFAPTDQAFANLKKNNLALYNQVAGNKKLLRSVLTYHVVGKRIPAAAAIAAAKKGLKVKTVQPWKRNVEDEAAGNQHPRSVQEFLCRLERLHHKTLVAKQELKRFADGYIVIYDEHDR